ncbi:MAG: hypothetical protein KDE28_19600, partial [Anaerolineales bacterium]|nr:hypothetical protein [Anaerolineales bacterium]
YGTTGRSCQSNGASQPVDVTPATEIELSWTWDWARFGILPPGTVVWWEWTVNDAAGQSVTSERQFATVADARFPFKEATADNVSVFWTMGDEPFGEQLLAYATAGLDRLETEMGIQLDEPITLVVYPTAADVQAAVIHVPEWAGGVAFPRYNSIIVGIAPGQDSWAASVIPHELTHLVVGALTFNCVGVDLPTWLNEGLAEFGETGAASSTAPELLNALDTGNVPALRRLANGFSAYGDDAGLAYVQSKTIVNFMISEYGQANLLLLLEAMRDGADIDDALQQVYGLDTDGLDGAWRESLGYQPLPTRQPTPDPAQATPVPTIAPFTLDLPAATATTSPTNTASPPTVTSTISPSPTASPTETAAATAVAA